MAAPRPRVRWSRLLAACGCVVLLGIGTCALLVYRGAGALSRRGGELVRSAGRSLETMAETAATVTEETLRARWNELREASRALETDEGVRALYRRNPLLASRFGSEEAFVARARRWRPKLDALGHDLPDWKDARPEVKPFLQDGVPCLEIAYSNERGSRVRFVWKGTELTYVEIQ